MKAELRKLNEVLVKSYDHENEDVPRSKAFQKAYSNLIKAVIKDSGWELQPKAGGGYCDWSGFIMKDGKYVYLSVSDFRWGGQDHWLNDILIRTAKHNKDYTGGMNHRTNIRDLVSKAESITR